MTSVSDSIPRPSASPLLLLLRSETFWVNAAFFLTFFPSTIFFIVPSLSQPVAAIAALPLLFLLPTPDNALTRWILVLLVGITAYMVASLFIYGQIAPEILTNGISYSLPPLYLLAMQNRAQRISLRVYRLALWLWLTIGITQYFSVFSAIQGLLQPVLKIFIADRFLMSHYTENRGVMFFSSEPSTAAPIILLFVICALFFHAQRRMSRSELLFSIAAALAMAAMNQSGSVVVLLLLAGIGAFLDRCSTARWSHKLLAAIIVILGIWGGATLTLAVNSKLRALVVLAQFARLVDPSELTAQNVIGGLSAIGGERIVPLLQGYGSLVDHYGGGHGIASWDMESVVAHVENVVGISVFDFPELRSENGVYQPEAGLGQTKPQSFLAAIAWDTGVPGLLLCLATIAAVGLKARKMRQPSEYRYLFLVPAVLHCAFFTQIPLLVPWLLFVFAITPGPFRDHIASGYFPMRPGNDQSY